MWADFEAMGHAMRDIMSNTTQTYEKWLTAKLDAKEGDDVEMVDDEDDVGGGFVCGVGAVLGPRTC